MIIGNMAQKLAAFIQRFGSGIKYRVGSDTTGALTALVQKFGVRGFPHAFLISEGKVVYSGHPMEPAFESALERIGTQTKKKNSLTAINAMTEEELANSSIGKLKEILKEMRVSPDGCIEKADLVARIIEFRPKLSQS